MLTSKNQENNHQSVLERFNFILSKLTVSSNENNIAKCRCPAHKDKSPSLEVKIQPHEKISVKCFVGCDYKSILGAIDLEPAFLYPPEQQKTGANFKVISSKPRISKIYYYQYANGHPAHETVRFEPKDFRHRKNASQKKWSLKGVKKVPYNLPTVIKNIKKEQPIIFIEGEKDADNGNKLGFICTTVPGGNGKWRDEYGEYFKGADIICIPDRDEPGIKGMFRIAKKLNKVAKRVRILQLPGKHKGDLSDWIEEGGDSEQLWSLIGLESLFLDEALLVNRLNKRHAVIMVQGKFVVINEDRNPALKRNEITLSSKNHFSDRYEHQPAKITKLKKDKKTDKYVEKFSTKPKGQIWIKSPQRRQFDGFCFNPQEPEEIDGFYNLWRGFAVKPKEGDCSLYYQHISEVIAQGNLEICDYILDWMADAVQNITERPGVTMVLRGGSGAGKGATIELFGRLFGQHFLPVSDSKHIVGHFNAHLKDCLILFADEAFYAGDVKHESIIKTLITSPTRMVEYKGKDVVILPNYTRLMMASNKAWVAPLEMDDRRFFILDVADKKVKDHEYFDALFKQMTKAKGSEALLYDLLHRDISKRNIKDYPITQAILDNKLESLDSVGQWIFYVLSNAELEYLGRSKNIFEIYETYVESCGKQRPASYNAWQRQMRKFFPSLKRIQKVGESKRYYDFPELEICREQFEARLYSKIDWDNHDNHSEPPF